ncbi:heavy metal translocating p-type atpase : Putative cadmium-transporting ATPase OS=alpha proteobacterium Q-1 GN=cadA PE=3 SV=1: E1-E2_ATPase: Hydrolase [Gemmataceae bacterium]|nr:heavy metal translocating p-type atpase : Putative cadmium-transporting ATPase OS=alpha proteobacterium Q-1 GN=cadA PE=3 SV=1: E1-E2_ATPase: Hydrolase [Gemmataceae bacterium]VTU01468.1 heavy metal translocating p-type atpase : Putative cadmium-transporting ATPase OS=alpha proteobacterium Q-1 GN=cadA PE=3 SV=1: E1-E2_ATPase: Hydrolase [Gemmataceae bacterium]
MATNNPALQFTIRGLDCAEEVAVLKREVGPLVGGEDNLGFDVLNGRMTVSGTGFTADQVRDAVARTGMSADLWVEGESPLHPPGYWERNRRTILTAASGGSLLAGIATHAAVNGLLAAFTEDSTSWPPVGAVACYALGIAAGVWTVLPKAWVAAKHLAPDMNLLMVVAVCGAVAINQWAEAATVAFLFSLSLALEAWSVGRARRAVAALMNLAPPTARFVHPDGREEAVAPDKVPVGAKFRVRPGDRVPLDGRVVEGSGGVDQSPITGESVPVLKSAGDGVYAGTINGDGLLTVESTKPASDTTLARITRMVGEAQSRRSPSEQWVEKFARYYTPAVMFLAAAVLALPPLAFGEPWGPWLYSSLVLLVIACPCALVISTPVSIVAALSSAARNGVLVKGGVHIETPARLKAVAMDKTGTLTEGKPAVVELVPLNDHTETELLERVAALEAHSTHPLAHAIVEYAKTRGVSIPPADDFRILPGKGAVGRVRGTEYWVGSHRYLEARGQETPEVHDRLEAMSRAGRTVVVVGNDRHVCGFIALADRVRPEAKLAVAHLRAVGIEHVVMLTGDNRGTAAAVAAEAGVDEVHAELLPADKVAKIEELVARYKSVAMVGDGVNDAPAMARATVGIAMGAAGTDAAIETADIALMSDDLSKLPWLVRHSRRTLAVIRQNVVFSLGVKAVFVALTLAGHSSMWAAVAADSGASLLVVFNGLRLLRTR